MAAWDGHSDPVSTLPVPPSLLWNGQPGAGRTSTRDEEVAWALLAGWWLPDGGGPLRHPARFLKLHLLQNLAWYCMPVGHTAAQSRCSGHVQPGWAGLLELQQTAGATKKSRSLRRVRARWSSLPDAHIASRADT
jgi:hypothetical protein